MWVMQFKNLWFIFVTRYMHSIQINKTIFISGKKNLFILQPANLRVSIQFLIYCLVYLTFGNIAWAPRFTSRVKSIVDNFELKIQIDSVLWLNSEESLECLRGRVWVGWWVKWLWYYQHRLLWELRGYI